MAIVFEPATGKKDDARKLPTVLFLLTTVPAEAVAVIDCAPAAGESQYIIQSCISPPVESAT
jgi:hypothetical protein